MIAVKNISKSFGTVRALSGVSFEAHKGEIVGFLGPNGAGKTTTMRCITGFLSPDEGVVEIDGVPFTEERRMALQQRIGYLPENNPLYKGMLVSEFIAFAADLKQLAPENKKKEIDFVVKATSIADVWYRPISELSKGYRQRVGLAAALVGSPEIVILDEPTEGLDPNQRAEIRTLIKGIAKARTVLLSTHVLQEALALCDRMVIIHQGSIVAQGTAEELGREEGGKHTLIVDVEGNNVEQALGALNGLENMQVHARESARRIHAKLISAQDIDLRPAVSVLAQKHQWILWRVSQEERTMEDIFSALTRNG